MAVPNVTYNIDVKSKFALFMDDDLCEAEPEELMRRANEDKKRRDKEAKEAKKKEKLVKSKICEGQVKEERSGIEGGSKKTENKFENTIKREPKTTESVTKPKIKAENVSKATERTYVKAESAPRVHTKAESVPRVEESSEHKDRSNKSKKTFDSGTKPRGREFDRHSGSDKTGVKAVERRDGSGSYNWGNLMDVVELPTFSEPKEEVVEEKGSTSTADVGDKKEPEKASMTISEWKALHSNDNIISSHVPTRPANNGENVFTGMNAYQKKNIHQNESDNEVVVPEDDTDSKGRRHIKVNIEFSGRARRGGRSGFNPRFKKDDVNKEFNKDDVIINLDEEEFPTLS